MVVGSIFAGSTFFLIKELLVEVDPVMITAYRFLGSGLILLALCLVYKRKVLKHLLKGFVLGIFLSLFFLLQNIGLETTSASQSSFLTGLFVVFVPFMAIFIEGERLKIFHIAVALMSGFGLWLVSSGVVGFGYGDLLSLIAGVVYAFFIVIGDKYIRKDDFDVLVLTMQQFLTVGLLSIAWVAFTTTEFGFGSTASLYKILYLVIFPSLISFGIINWVQEYLSAFLVSVLMTLTTVFGVLMAWTIGGESFGVRDVVGGIVLVVAIVLPALGKIRIRLQDSIMSQKIDNKLN